MKLKFFIIAIVLIGVGWFVKNQFAKPDYDVYAYVEECKKELEITEPLLVLSCLDGNQVPIYVNQQEINEENWEDLNENRQCDNPHWLGGNVGCWTYSHLQIRQLNPDNIMILNCRQKGDQLGKDWFRLTNQNLGMNQLQRKKQYEKAILPEKEEYYYLYNTFNDIGIILRNTRSGKSCYITQYGEAVVGFLPPLDRPLPDEQAFLNEFNPDQSRPPDDFPKDLWYRDANAAFRAPAFTAKAGCIDCHNANGVKYSPYINSKQGLPSIYAMSQLPFLPVGKPFKDHFNQAGIRQINTDPIDGESQLCTRCHTITTSGTCGHTLEFATNHPSSTLSQWLTTGSRNNWMPPVHVDSGVIKKHVGALKCCCQYPESKGCLSRQFGPTEADVPVGFAQGEGWVKGEKEGLCLEVLESVQWGADKM